MKKTDITLRCIDTGNCKGLTKGKIYKAYRYLVCNTMYIIRTNDLNHHGEHYCKEYFEVVDNKISNITNEPIEGTRVSLKELEEMGRKLNLSMKAIEEWNRFTKYTIII